MILNMKTTWGSKAIKSLGIECYKGIKKVKRCVNWFKSKQNK